MSHRLLTLLVSWSPGALLFLAAPGLAQDPGLVVPVPAIASVEVRTDSFTAPDGSRRAFDVTRSRGTPRPVPVMVFVNSNGPALRQWRGYVEWARLVTRTGLAGLLYEGLPFDPSRSPRENVQLAMATIDSVLAALGRKASALGVEADNVVLWAGSSNTTAGTPAALGAGSRRVRGYVLYYGSGQVETPRLDVPVFVARAGLDSPGLNQQLDSLTQRLVASGVTVTLASHPGGRHGFDVLDSTATTARIIDQTLEFAAGVTRREYQRAVAASVAEVRAAAAFSARRWSEAVTRYREVAQLRPNAGGVAWRLGLSELENGEPAAALASFDRARALGVGGARDIGLPAARAALRANDRDRAAQWISWALQSFPRIRAEIAADAELAPLLEHPAVKQGG